MHGRAAVAAGLLRQSVLERAGDVGLVEDVERAEGIGDEHRAVDQVVGQPESGDAYDAVLLVSHDQNTRPTVRPGGETLQGKAPPALQLCRGADRADEGEGTVKLLDRQQIGSASCRERVCQYV